MDAERTTAAPAADHTQAVSVPGFTLRRGVHPRGSRLPRHSHDDPTLCYVFQGRFTEYSAGHVADCRTDALKLTPAGEPHSDRFIADETRGLRIDIDRARFVDHPEIYHLLDERVELTSGEVSGLVHRAVAQLEVADFAAQLAVEGLLLELLAALAREAMPPMEPPRPRWLVEADALIHELYSTPISLGDIALAVGVAPATLARAYRRAYHTSVGERVRRLRIEQASRELAQTTEPLAAIAVRAGFFDQSHFTNVFRSYTGVSPGRFRAGLARAVAAPGADPDSSAG